MTQFNITLNVNELKAALACAAKNDIRHYLNGVCADFIEPGKVALIATEGHCMFVCRANTDSTKTDFVGKIIIPGETIELALKTLDKSCKIINLSDTTLGNINYKPIDGAFPDYRRVIPAAFKPSIAHFDNAVASRAVKSMMLYEELAKSSNRLPILQNGDNAAVIQSESRQALVILMPLRQLDGDLTYEGFTL